MTISKDLKQWYAIACPTTGVRFDLRMLELMDTDKDGRVRSPEVKAALEYLKAKGISPDDLDHPTEEDEKKLADVLKRQAELEKAEDMRAETLARHLAHCAQRRVSGGRPDDITVMVSIVEKAV